MLLPDLWHKSDQIVDLHCNASNLGHKFDMLESEFHRTRVQIIESPKGFEDFTALRDSEFNQAELILRKVGWLSFHCPGGDLIAVAPKLIHVRDRKAYSPVLDQLRIRNIKVNDVDLDNFYRQLVQSSSAYSNRLGGIVYSPKEKTLYLCQGVSFGRASKGGLHRVVLRDAGTLWGEPDCLAGGLKVPANLVNGLYHAKKMFESALPDTSVRTLFFVVDNDYGWHFQCHELTGVGRESTGTRVNLDQYPIFDSSLSFMDQLRADPDYLAKFPPGLQGMDLPHLLKKVPFDRCTRSMMLLYQAYEIQRQNGPQLMTTEAKELAELVASEYELNYTIDARRHDLEDCLRASNLVRKARYRINSYGITHVGVARILTLLHKYNRMAPTSSANVLKMSVAQSKKWLGDSGSMTA